MENGTKKNIDKYNENHVIYNQLKIYFYKIHMKKTKQTILKTCDRNKWWWQAYSQRFADAIAVF